MDHEFFVAKGREKGLAPEGILIVFYKLLQMKKSVRNGS